MRHKSIFVLGLLLLALLMVACGGDDETADTGNAASPPTADNRTGENSTSNSGSTAPQDTGGVLPQRAFDPSLDDWTLLVYIDGDNNLELAGVIDVNEMEAAGNSDRVNVLVQLDRVAEYTNTDGNWTGARRYEIRPDSNPNKITSPVVADLGEVNMGDGAALTDFLVWGITNYPANHYGVILWDHGSGWFGIAFDDTANGDGLTLPEVKGSLTQALTQTGAGRLDFVGFDACLMGQIDVFQLVQPYARYAVGSEEVVPAQGWDYTAWLGGLYANTGMEGAELAQTAVTSYMNFYTKIEPDEFVTMAAVDLDKLAGLTNSLNTLAAALKANPTNLVSAIGDARGGAEGYALMYPEDARHFASIDLWHFASILAQISPDAAVNSAAQGVISALETAVLVADHGSGFSQAHGISVYFPQTAEYFNGRYPNESPLSNWNDFLTSYHGLGLASVGTAEFNILNVLSSQASLQAPTYLDVQIKGNDIASVILFAGRYENGQRRLVTFDYLIPEPTILPDGSSLYEWRDGQHDDFFIWDTQAPYIYDSTGAGDFAAMFPTEYNSPLYVVRGYYLSVAGGDPFNANLVFNTTTQSLDGVWTFQDAETRNAPNEITPQPGDKFQIGNLMMDDAGNAAMEPGAILTFDGNAQVYYAWQPLPSGEYFLGFSAETIAGNVAEKVQDFTVTNDNLLPGYYAYLDPYNGFQFLYPESWYAPSYGDGRLYTYDIATGTTVMNMTFYVGADSAAILKQDVLTLFGNPELIFETDTVVADEPATATVYTYEADNGPHSGILMTFVHQGIGYVVDVDGPTADQEFNVQAVTDMINSWVFQPISFGPPPIALGETPTAPAGDAGDAASPASSAANDYVQSFNDVGNWATGSSDDVTGEVVNGVYDLFVSATNGLFWTTGGESFADGIYEVEATQMEGPVNNGYGMLFRVNNDTNDFYLLEVSGDGYVWIGRCADSCNEAEALVEGGWFQSTAVKQGVGQTNFLRVVAEGPSMAFYVNGVEVGRISDAGGAVPLPAGDIGLFVETLGEGGVGVAFDNFRFTPSRGK